MNVLQQALEQNYPTVELVLAFKLGTYTFFRIFAYVQLKEID